MVTLISISMGVMPVKELCRESIRDIVDETMKEIGGGGEYTTSREICVCVCVCVCVLGSV